MKKACPFVVLFILCLSAYGQQQTPTPDPENDVVKITTKLVQLDLLVVDKDGKQVRDLTAGDFVVLQDGKPQKISNFSYVNTEAGRSALPAKVADGLKDKENNTAAQPPVRISAANAGRIITFIVDDGNCSVSTTGVKASRQGIEKFINEQMHPTDMVAIYQTRAGNSAFQQYTNDKVQLLKAAHKIQWYPPPGSCNSTDGSFFEAAKSNTYVEHSVTGTSTKTIESDSDRKSREHAEDAVNNNQVVGALGLIRYVVKGLQRVPGRKIVFLLSDGMPLRDRSGALLGAEDALQDLTDLSNRASVVFNTVDSRGLFDAKMIEARDEVYAQDDVNATDKVGNDRANAAVSSQDGLAFLARETGGKFYQGQNFLDAPIKNALSLETGYYLIGYEPSDETFKGKKFNKIEIKVNRPDAKVISRTGFLGIVDEVVTKPKRKSADSDLYEAIVAPLPQPGLSVGLSAYFGNSASGGNFVRSFFHLDGKEITFVDDNGMKKAVFDVVAVTMDEKNKVVDEFTRTHTIRFKPEAMPLIERNGLVYSVDVPIKKPGTYNFRVAVRDGSSRTVGSAGQIVQIPDLKKSGVFLSGVIVTEVDQAGKFTVPAAPNADNAFSLPMTTAVPAIRQFRRGAMLAYAYTLYNARLDKTTGKPNVSLQVNMYRDGKLVLEGLPQPAAFEKQEDWTRINDFGYMRLNPQIEAGSYALQIQVRDLAAGGKNDVTSQWVDFEVVE